MDSINVFILELAMSDISFKGNPYTWCNNKNYTDRIRERLDQGIVNGEWITTYPNTILFHKPTIGSDHSPILLMLDHRDSRGRKEFRFEAM